MSDEVVKKPEVKGEEPKAATEAVIAATVVTDSVADLKSRTDVNKERDLSTTILGGLSQVESLISGNQRSVNIGDGARIQQDTKDRLITVFDSNGATVNIEYEGDTKNVKSLKYSDGTELQKQPDGRWQKLKDGILQGEPFKGDVKVEDRLKGILSIDNRDSGVREITDPRGGITIREQYRNEERGTLQSQQAQGRVLESKSEFKNGVLQKVTDGLTGKVIQGDEIKTYDPAKPETDPKIPGIKMEPGDSIYKMPPRDGNPESTIILRKDGRKVVVQGGQTTEYNVYNQETRRLDAAGAELSRTLFDENGKVKGFSQKGIGEFLITGTETVDGKTYSKFELQGKTPAEYLLGNMKVNPDGSRVFESPTGATTITKDGIKTVVDSKTGQIQVINGKDVIASQTKGPDGKVTINVGDKYQFVQGDTGFTDQKSGKTYSDVKIDPKTGKIVLTDATTLAQVAIDARGGTEQAVGADRDVRIVKASEPSGEILQTKDAFDRTTTYSYESADGNRFLSTIKTPTETWQLQKDSIDPKTGIGLWSNGEDKPQRMKMTVDDKGTLRMEYVDDSKGKVREFNTAGQERVVYSGFGSGAELLNNQIDLLVRPDGTKMPVYRGAEGIVAVENSQGTLLVSKGQITEEMKAKYGDKITEVAPSSLRVSDSGDITYKEAHGGDRTMGNWVTEKMSSVKDPADNSKYLMTKIVWEGDPSQGKWTSIYMPQVDDKGNVTHVGIVRENPLGAGEVYHYIDPKTGEKTEPALSRVNYDSNLNQLTVQKEKMGQTEVFDQNGRKIAIRGDNGRVDIKYSGNELTPSEVTTTQGTWVRVKNIDGSFAWQMKANVALKQETGAAQNSVELPEGFVLNEQGQVVSKEVGNKVITDSVCTTDGDKVEKTIEYPDGRKEVIKYFDKKVVDGNGEQVTERTLTRPDGTNVVTRFNAKGDRLQTLYKNEKGQVTVAEGQGITTWFTYDDKGQVKAIVSTNPSLNREMQPDGTWKGPGGIEKWDSVKVDDKTGWTTFKSADLERTVFTWGFVKDTKSDGSSVVDIPGGTGTQYNINAHRPIEVDISDPKNVVVKAGDLTIGTFDGKNVEQADGNTYIYKDEDGKRVLDRVLTGDKIVTIKDGKPVSTQQVVAKTEMGSGPRYELKTLTGAQVKIDLVGNTVILDEKGNKLVVYSGDKTITFKTPDSNDLLAQISTPGSIVDTVTDAATGKTYKQTSDGVEITGPDGKKEFIKGGKLEYNNLSLKLSDGVNTIELAGQRYITETSSGIVVQNKDGSIVKVNSTTGHVEVIKYDIKDGKIVPVTTQSFRGSYRVTANGDFLLYNTESGAMTTIKATGEPSVEVSREITATFTDGSFTIDKQGVLIYTPNDLTKPKIEVGKAIVNTETGTPIITAEYSKAAYEYFKNTGVATRQIVLGSPGTNAPYVIEENGKLIYVDKMGVRTEFKPEDKVTVDWISKPPTISIGSNDPKLQAIQSEINNARELSAQIVFAKTQDIKEERFKPVAFDAKGNPTKFEQVADMPTTLTLRGGEKVDLTKLGFGVASTSTERNTLAEKVPVVASTTLPKNEKGEIDSSVAPTIVGADTQKIATPNGTFGPSIAASVEQAAEAKKRDLTVRASQVMDTVSLDIRKAFVNSGGVIPENATPAEKAALQILVERSKAMDISAPKLLERMAEYRFNLAVGDTKAYLDPKFVGALLNDPSIALKFNPKIATVSTDGFSPLIKDGVSPLPVPTGIDALRKATAERAATDLKLPGDVLSNEQRIQYERDRATLSAALTVAKTDGERVAIAQAIEKLDLTVRSTSESLRVATLDVTKFGGELKGPISVAEQSVAKALYEKFQFAKQVNEQVLQTATAVAAGVKQATSSAERIEELRVQLTRVQTTEKSAVVLKEAIENQIKQERIKLVESLNAALNPLGLKVVHSPDEPNGISGALGKYVIEPLPLDTSGLPPHLTTMRPSQIDISQIADPAQRAIVAALQVREMTTAAMKQYVDVALTMGALNRSAMDFLPSFMLTGDLNPLKSASAKPFAQSITSLPVDLNTRVSALSGRGMNTIVTADGTMISIERALANPALLAHLLATNQISINTLNGVLASADLVRILNIAVAGGLSYTQLTNMSNPELIKYFGAGTIDGVKMGFNVQVGYTSGLVYTSQNGILVPARMGNLEDGIFIQSVQGQKTITEAIKSGSNFVTISNGKNRSDEDDDEDEEDEDGVIVTGSKEDFGGKIPTAQPVTTQTTANHDPTAVLAHNQPVPLPDFLIFPDGSMEPMPAEWKTKANHDHGHVDVIDENGKHMHVIDAKGNILTDQQIEKAKQDRAAAKAAEANAANSDFSPLAPNASLNVPLEISDFIANFDIENQGQAAYIDNDVKQADNLIDPLAHIKSLPIDPNTGFPYDPDTGYILNPNTGDIIGNINDQSVANSISANPFDGRLVDPVTGFPYDPTTGILYDPLTGNPVGSITPEADPIIDLSNEIATIQDNVETRLDDISAYSHVQDALHDAQEVEDIPTEIAADISRPESMDFGTDEEYKEKEKERLDNILNQLEEEEKRLEEQEDELRKRRDEIERLTKLMNSLLATRRQAELDRIRRLIEQQRKIEEFITKDIRRIKYTVRKGDTLENISKKHFRDPRLARLIYEMNPAKIKLSQEEGKTAYQLTLNSVLTLPSPRQAREWISRGKYLTTVDNSYVAQTELTADDLANMEKRRLNVENVLGALGMAADTNYKPSYTVRFGDSLRSIAMKHPALNDVSLWRLLAKVNDMSIETDAMGTPKVTLERGTALNLPSKEEIAQFRKDNGALVHPSSLKHGANGPADLVTNVTLFKECPSCKENTPSGVSLCHCCGHVFQESASGIGPDTKISTVSKQVALTNIGGASTEHDPLAPKQNDDENNVHTLNLPEPERKVANSDVSPLPKTEVDPKGVPNVSAAAKSDITLKLNDPLGSRADAGSGIVSGSSVVPTSDSLLNSMANMHKARKDSSVPSREYQMSKLVENLSDTSRIVLLDSELDLNNQKAERWQLEVLKDDEWTPVVAYEIIGDNSMRHEYNITGKAKKSIKMNLPSAAVEEMVRNDLSRNWQDYCQKFLAGKKLSQ